MLRTLTGGSGLTASENWVTPEEQVGSKKGGRKIYMQDI